MVAKPKEQKPEEFRTREFYFSQKTFKRVGRDWGRANRGRVIAVRCYSQEVLEKYKLEETKSFRDSPLANVIALNELNRGYFIQFDLFYKDPSTNVFSYNKTQIQKVYFFSTIFDRRTLLPLSSAEHDKKPNCEMTHQFPDTFEVMVPYPVDKPSTSLRKLPFSVDQQLKKLKPFLKERNHIAFQLNEDRQVVKTAITPLL